MHNIMILITCFSLFFSFQVLTGADASAGQARVRHSECDLAGRRGTLRAELLNFNSPLLAAGN